jgi:type VI secretion system secreted protein Hcp
MKKRLVRLLAVLAMLLACTFGAVAATHIRMTVDAAKQGRFKADVTRRSGGTETTVLRFQYMLNSPRDAAGQATGKAQHSPVTITKDWGASSPQFYQACTTNEVLKSVVIEFLKTGPDGKEYVFQTVKLTNATVSRVFQYVGDPPTAGQPPEDRELEDISFTFQKIEMENSDGRTAAADDWTR